MNTDKAACSTIYARLETCFGEPGAKSRFVWMRSITCATMTAMPLALRQAAGCERQQMADARWSGSQVRRHLPDVQDLILFGRLGARSSESRPPVVGHLLSIANGRFQIAQKPGWQESIVSAKLNRTLRGCIASGLRARAGRSSSARGSVPAATSGVRATKLGRFLVEAFFAWVDEQSSAVACCRRTVAGHEIGQMPTFPGNP